jgi:hypothetical protein
VPTAQALPSEAIATPLREAPPAGVGLGTCAHTVPSHRKISVLRKPWLVMAVPTAQAVLAEVAATLERPPLTEKEATGPEARAAVAGTAGATQAATPASSGTASSLAKRVII